MKKQPGPVLCQGLLVFTLFLAGTGYLPAQSPPDQARSRLLSGINLYSQGKWADAVTELRRLQAEAPGRDLQGEAFFWIAMAELSAGDYEKALADMDALEAADPSNSRIKELPYHRGRALYYLGRYNEAIVLLKGYADTLMSGQGKVLSPAETARRPAALYWTGECLFSMGQFDKAADVFRLITDEYPGTAKYEASRFRLDLISQKKVEAELLNLLKVSHEEALKNSEEYRQREASYDQALSAYQKRIADMLKDTRLKDLEESNASYREQLDAAAEKIRSLESSLRDVSLRDKSLEDKSLVDKPLTDKSLAETSAAPEKALNAGSMERLKALKSSARELEARILSQGGNSGGSGK